MIMIYYGVVVCGDVQSSRSDVAGNRASSIEAPERAISQDAPSSRLVQEDEYYVVQQPGPVIISTRSEERGQKEHATLGFRV